MKQAACRSLVSYLPEMNFGRMLVIRIIRYFSLTLAKRTSDNIKQFVGDGLLARFVVLQVEFLK